MHVRGLSFHHFGLAARDPERAAEFIRFAGYECGDRIHDPLQGVDLRWCTRPDAPAVEIVSPVHEDGPLASVLVNQATSFYHLCYEIDVEAASIVTSMRNAGLRVVTVLPPKPALLFDGRNVSFHIVQGFGLIELL